MSPRPDAGPLASLADASPASHLLPQARAHGTFAAHGLSTNAAVLDAVVFVIGFSLLGGVLIWYARRIFGDS